MKAHISDLFILEQIYSTEKKPYDIIKGIRKKFDADYKPSTGMIYPSLKRLMGNNLITKNEGRYKITEAGIEYFNKNKENYEKMVENFTENKIFFRNLRKSVLNLIDVIKESDKDYIKNNQDKIIRAIDEISSRISKMEIE